MELAEQTADGVMVPAIQGRLDNQSVDQFHDRLIALVEAGRSRVLVDAAGLTYVSSLGFRALLLAAKCAAEAGGNLALCGLPVSVQRVVDLAGFGDVPNIHPPRESATAALAAP